MRTERFTITTADGRSLSALTAGPLEGLALVFHTGTPAGLAELEALFDAAAANGLWTVMYARPGYGVSDALPGRQVADAAADVAAILDHVGARRFVTAGWSGGGPHALATAAVLGGRCAAAATIAGVAPYPADGLDWLAGMAPANAAEFGAALQGEDQLTPLLETEAAELSGVTAAHVAEAFGNLVTPADQAALTGEFASYIAESTRAAVSHGIAGWRDDDLAFVRDWGIELDEITVPVSIWQGDQDAMVPLAHGEWLAQRIPGARPHLLPGEGHLTLVSGRIGDILGDLVSLAGSASAPATG